MKNYSAETVDDYIASSDIKARPKLKELRDFIKPTIPEAEETISWGVPFYKYHGLLGGFATFKNHVSFGLAYVLDDKDRELLAQKGYKSGRKTIQINFDQKIPITIIRKILLTKIKQNKER